MKKLGACIVALLLAGCGTLQSSYSYQDDVDVEYMAAVEGAAKRYGTQVVWINTPRKRTSATQ